MEDAYRRYRSMGLEIFAFDVRKGTPQQTTRFAEETGVSFPVLVGGAAYADANNRLGTHDNRGALLVLGRAGGVVHPWDKGYRSLKCFEPKYPTGVLEEALSLDGEVEGTEEILGTD